MKNLFIALILILIFSNLSFSQSDSDHSMERLDQKLKAGDFEQMTSILVSQNGELIFEKYYNGADESTLHNTRSATKTLASILVGIAIKEGYINSEKDQIMQYLQNKRAPMYPDPKKATITIEDLLTMSSCLECDDNNQISKGQEERMYITEDWTQFYLDLPVRGFPEWETGPADSPYGRAWRYCSAGANALAEIIQNAVGMPLDKYAEEKLFKPLGFGNYRLSYSPKGILSTAGGNHIRSRDFLKLAEIYNSAGQWKGEEIITKDWVNKSISPKAAAFEGMEYGYLFWLKDSGQEGQAHPSAIMSGNGGNKVVSVPSLDVAIVITSKNYNNSKAHIYSHDIIDNYIVPWILSKN